MKVFFQLCWIASFAWILLQWYWAWRAFLRVIQDQTLWTFQRIPPLSLFFSSEHRTTLLYAVMDTFITLKTATIIVDIVPGVSAGGVGSIVGLLVSYTIRKAISDVSSSRQKPVQARAA